MAYANFTNTPHFLLHGRSAPVHLGEQLAKFLVVADTVGNDGQESGFQRYRVLNLFREGQGQQVFHFFGAHPVHAVDA